jgi:hypothetical protein
MPLRKMLPDLVAVTVDRGDEDVAGLVAAELDDEFGEVGLKGVDAGGLRALR